LRYIQVDTNYKIMRGYAKAAQRPTPYYRIHIYIPIQS
jgi:hypothetical protein